MKALTPEQIRLTALTRMAAAEVDPVNQSGMIHLKDRRKAAGLLVTEAARRVGVSSLTYRNWDRGLNWPASYWLPAIAQALGCTVEELYLPPDTGGDNETQ